MQKYLYHRPGSTQVAQQVSVTGVLQHQHHGLLQSHTAQHVDHKLLVVVVGARNCLHHLNLLQEVGLLRMIRIP